MCFKSSLSLHTNCLISPKLDLLRLIPIHFIYLLLLIQQPSIPRQGSCKCDHFWGYHPATSIPMPQNQNPEGLNPDTILDLNVHRVFLKKLCCFYLHFFSQSPVLGMPLGNLYKLAGAGDVLYSELLSPSH